MESIIDNVTETSKEISKDIKEVIKERFFSPMYFYFILAWIIYNWTFVYSLFFLNSKSISKLKIDYLLSFYPTDSFLQILQNIWYVFLGPAISTYIIIWWISILSEKSYSKFESYKSNKRTIKRGLEYAEKVKIAKEERVIRDAESDKDEIRYIDQPEFNNWLDDVQDNVSINGLDYLPSEVLFNTDPENYKEQLNDFLTQSKTDSE